MFRWRTNCSCSLSTILCHKTGKNKVSCDVFWCRRFAVLLLGSETLKLFCSLKVEHWNQRLFSEAFVMDSKQASLSHYAMMYQLNTCLVFTNLTPPWMRFPTAVGNFLFTSSYSSRRRRFPNYVRTWNDTTCAFEDWHMLLSASKSGLTASFEITLETNLFRYKWYVM